MLDLPSAINDLRDIASLRGHDQIDLALKAVELGEILGADDEDAGYDQLLLREIRDALVDRLMF